MRPLDLATGGLLVGWPLAIATEGLIGAPGSAFILTSVLSGTAVGCVHGAPPAAGWGGSTRRRRRARFVVPAAALAARATLSGRAQVAFADDEEAVALVLALLAA